MGVTGLSVDLELTPGFPVTYGGAQSAGARDPPCLHPSERKRERERGRETERVEHHRPVSNGVTGKAKKSPVDFM